MNTETNALAAFYGTQLSYWSRIDLYDAAGYLNTVSTGFTGTLITASGDQLPAVTVASGGVFGGSGTVNGNLTVQSGGALGAQGNGTTSYTGLTVAGAANLQAGSKVELTGVFLPGKQYTLLTTTGNNTVTVDSERHRRYHHDRHSVAVPQRQALGCWRPVPRGDADGELG